MASIAITIILRATSGPAISQPARRVAMQQSEQSESRKQLPHKPVVKIKVVRLLNPLLLPLKLPKRRLLLLKRPRQLPPLPLLLPKAKAGAKASLMATKAKVRARSLVVGLRLPLVMKEPRHVWPKLLRRGPQRRRQ